MKYILQRAIAAFQILLDIIWVAVMAALALTLSGLAVGICARVFMWGYNLIPL